MHRLLSYSLLGLALVSCAPADVNYCSRQGLEPGSPPYIGCLQHYTRMEQWFRQDLAQCTAPARQVYPDALYDRTHYERVAYFNRFGHHRHTFVAVEPDRYHNRMVDDLRNNIIWPCMEKKGWNNTDSWESGRHKPPFTR